MKKRLLVVFLLAALCLVGCPKDEPDEQSSSVPSDAQSFDESFADMSATEEQSLLTFGYNKPPFANYADYAEFMKQSGGEAMVISTNYDAVTGDCDWQYAATDREEIEKELIAFSMREDNPIKNSYITHWLILPNGNIFGCYSPEISVLAQKDEDDTRLFGVKCRIKDDPNELYVSYSYGYLYDNLYTHMLYALGLFDEEVAALKDNELFTYVTHKPPFEFSTIYQELQRRADGRAVVCSYDGYDKNYNEVWNYKFVEMQDGPQALKDDEDTIILQDAPSMKNIWLENFVIFPDGTIYGTYTPSVSERVAKVCEVDTDRDYGTIFSVDSSKYNIAYEQTQCFLPEGVFELLERELGEIEGNENKYLFKVPEEYLADDPTGMPFDSIEDLKNILYGNQFACFERVTDEDGTVHWETVYRWGGQDPIWQIDELFTPTDKNYYGDGYDLFLIDTPAARYDTSDGSLISIRMYAMFAENLHDEVINGYEKHAGKPYGAIYTFDMTAEELTYTVEYGYFEKSIAGFIDVVD